jgi:hypothetical protein
VNTPADILDAIYQDFSAWAAQDNGRVHVARDLDAALSLVADSAPGGWTAVLHWQGEDPAGTGTRRGNVVEHNLRVFLQANLGPTAKPDIALIRATAARPNPFLDLVASVRTRMLCYVFPGVRPPGDRLSYKGCSDQVGMGGYLVAVYSLLFGVYAPIEMPAENELITLGKAV